MAIIHFINPKRYQNKSGMYNVLAYISQEKKAGIYVSGYNCTPETVLLDFNATKNLYHKNDGRQYYHLVQSFEKHGHVSPELAHKIALEFAKQAFKEYEVLFATHHDREHIHTHFVINSVSFETGKKYHSNEESIKALMNLSDKICLEHGLTILPEYQKKQKQMQLSDREYRVAKKGESWKFQLMSDIDNVMKQAKSQKQFCFLMQGLGYYVSWQDTHKYITYTCPNKRKVRDIRLHGEKYLKGNMENEFRIRSGELKKAIRPEFGKHVDSRTSRYGSREQLDSNSTASTDSFGYADTVIEADGTAINTEGFRTGIIPDEAGASGNLERGEQHTKRDEGFIEGLPFTGWESERELYQQGKYAGGQGRKTLLELPQRDIHCDRIINAGFDFIQSLFEVDYDGDEDIDYSNCPQNVDRKLWAEIARKKEVMGIKMS